MYGNQNTGFTLIELSLVLVIIGLIVGGVLTGRDLIHVAELRRTASQIQSVDTAIRTFQLKYGQLPGDFDGATRLWANASAYDGDNDGVIDAVEGANFWHHLMLAGLVSGMFVGADVNAPPDLNNYPPIAGAISGPLFAMQTSLRGLYLSEVDTMPYPPLPATEDNYLIITGVPMPLDSDGIYNVLNLGWSAQGLQTPIGPAPLDAQWLDVKLDDGLPFSGRIGSIFSSIGTATQSCTDLGGANKYNSQGSWGSCAVWHRL